jgi:hypothetical protein
MKKILFSSLLAISFAVIASAQTATPVVNARQKNQKERIKDGVQNGELTKAEAEKLRAQQANIRQAEAKAKADGTVTAEERAKLDAKQDKASTRIYNNKHDAQTRPAQPATPVVDAREKSQHDRIKDGVQSGELTKAEAEKARAEQANIKRAEAKAKSDGTVTAAERAKLDAKQDKASKRIFKNKHDAQKRN